MRDVTFLRDYGKEVRPMAGSDGYDYWLKRGRADEERLARDYQAALASERWARWRVAIVALGLLGAFLLHFAVDYWCLDSRLYCWWRQCSVLTCNGQPIAEE
jgi:hypothetical protein